MMGFTKLDEGILQSSIMAESPKIFKVWIALLAACRYDGVARVSSVFLSSVCHLPIKDIENAIDFLMQPDPPSRSINDDGRRIRRVDGGYYIINYQKYRAFTYSDSPEAVRQRRHRRKKKDCDAPLHVTKSRDISASASSSEFEEFYKRYPRKQGKQDALAAFKAIAKKESIDEIMQALGGYLAVIDREQTPMKFIKLPATFLRAERWRDHLPERKLTLEEFQKQQAEELERLRGKR